MGNFFYFRLRAFAYPGFSWLMVVTKQKKNLQNLSGLFLGCHTAESLVFLFCFDLEQKSFSTLEGNEENETNSIRYGLGKKETGVGGARWV